MPMNPEQLMTRRPQLHVLTDFFLQQRFSHQELTRMALDAGADVIQFRQKSGPIRTVYQACLSAREQCLGTDGLFIVNDRLDLALAVSADGLHIGQSDLPADVARRVLGPDRILGVTATTTAEALKAEADGADYIGFGPVFETQSKDSPASVKGLEGLQSAASAVSIPVIAIAGIQLDRIASSLSHGAAGVAVMSAITEAMHPDAITAKFRAALDMAYPVV